MSCRPRPAPPPRRRPAPRPRPRHRVRRATRSPSGPGPSQHTGYDRRAEKRDLKGHPAPATTAQRRQPARGGVPVVGRRATSVFMARKRSWTRRRGLSDVAVAAAAPGHGIEHPAHRRRSSRWPPTTLLSDHRVVRRGRPRRESATTSRRTSGQLRVHRAGDARPPARAQGRDVKGEQRAPPGAARTVRYADGRQDEKRCRSWWRLTTRGMIRSIRGPKGSDRSTISVGSGCRSG